MDGEVRRGGVRRVDRERQGEERRVEVKATGEHAFQELKAKDLKADFLVWVRFGRRFELGQGPIEIAILSDPSGFIPGACRLDTARFERRVGSTDALRILSFDSLEALLARPGGNSWRFPTSLSAHRLTAG